MPFDGAPGKLRAVAAKSKTDESWAARNVVAAVAAFRELTGKSATEPESKAAWRIFWQALLSVGEPTPERAAWVAECVKPFRATLAQRKARVPQVLLARKCDPPNYRHALLPFDARFEALTDTAITRAFGAIWKRFEKHPPVSLNQATPYGWYSAIAKVALAVGAFDVARRVGESEKAAVDRIANTLRAEYDEHERTRPKLKKPRT